MGADDGERGQRRVKMDAPDLALQSLDRPITNRVRRGAV
jgi:hypothetical protein